jgi:hypothetical protein
MAPWTPALSVRSTCIVTVTTDERLTSCMTALRLPRVAPVLRAVTILNSSLLFLSSLNGRLEFICRFATRIGSRTAY